MLWEMKRWNMGDVQREPVATDIAAPQYNTMLLDFSKRGICIMAAQRWAGSLQFMNEILQACDAMGCHSPRLCGILQHGSTMEIESLPHGRYKRLRHVRAAMHQVRVQVPTHRAVPSNMAPRIARTPNSGRVYYIVLQVGF